MGRSLDWYVIPKVIPHDTTKPLCFGWEFQDDEDVMEDDVFEKVAKEADKDYEKIIGEDTAVYFKRLATQRKKQKEIIYETLYNSPIESWCPKCHMYTHLLR